MKITFLSPAPNLSGGQKVIAIYADRLMARGHDVTVVARNFEAPTFIGTLRHLVRERNLPSAPKETHFNRMGARLILPRHSGPLTARDVPDADIVIATWWETAFEAVHFPSSKGKKFYFIQGHEVFPYLPTHLSGASYYLPLRKIAIASWLVDTMRDMYGDPHVALVPNAVDREQFFAPKRQRHAVPTVGMIYSTTPFKGVQPMLSAVEMARQIHPQLRVIAFGTSRPTRGIPLPSYVKFHHCPSQDSIRDLYASCDVFLSASRSEGFCLPILEAMACRTPVVATRTGCAGDVIDNGRNGFVVDIEDIGSLSSRLIEILSMKTESWESMSNAAYATAMKYDWDYSTLMLEKALVSQ